jgi:hypothetical protein
MDWYITAPGGQEYFVDASDWELTRVLDASRPSEGKIVIPRSTPALKKSWVRAEEDGQNRFLGYISRHPSISGAKQNVEVRGVEALLWQCHTGNYGYMAAVAGTPFTRLQHIFSSDAPTQGYDRWRQKGAIGLIWYANSRIPPGRGYFTKGYVPYPYGGEASGLVARGPWVLFDFSRYIYRLPGGGTNSRIGSAPIYLNGSLMAEKETYADLQSSSDISCYRDTADLFVKIYDTAGLYLGELNNEFFANNWRDTKVRLGQLDRYDTYLDAPFRVGHENLIGDLLLGIAEVHEQNVRWRYCNDGICRMDVLEDFEDDGVFDIIEADCEKIEFITSSEMEPDALIGLGHGSSHVRQTHSIVNLAPGGAFFETNETFDGGFNDPYGSMFSLTKAKWDSMQRGELIQITSRNHDYLQPGNMANLHLSDECLQSKAVHKILLKSGSSAVISLGGREYDIIDAIRAKRDISNAYLAQSLYELTDNASNSGNITIGDLDTADTPYTTPGAYALPARDLKDLPVWLIDVSIKAPSKTVARTPICTFWICVHTSTTGIDNYAIPNAGTQWYQLGETVEGIDLTQFATWGGSNYVRVHCRFRGYWDTTPPACTCSIESRIYARRRI